MKKIKYKNKILVSLVALFTMLMCVSVGFASWIVTSGSNALALGQIQADDVATDSGIQVNVITIENLDEFKFATNYGFVKNKVYSQNVDLTGTCSFNASNGQNCFTTFRNNNSFKLDITLTTAINNGFSSNGFVCNSMVLTSSNFSGQSISASSIDNGSTITASFVVICLDNENDFNFDFLINISWSGTSFPNMSDSNISIQFKPKENI